MKKYTKKSGFTLAETLVTIGIFVILMGGISLLFKEIYVTSNQQLLSLDSIDRVRLELFTFTNEIRNATSGNDGSYPLNQAGDSQIILFSKFGASGNNVNRIRYYVASSTLYKGTVTPSGNPLAYNLANEKILPVVTNISSTTQTIFTYYDSNYTGTSTPLAQPINVNQVKFVKINLIVTKQDVRNSTSTFSIATGATMRNLKTNLGN